MFNKPTSEAISFNKSSCLTAPLGVTKFTMARVIILVTLQSISSCVTQLSGEYSDEKTADTCSWHLIASLSKNATPSRLCKWTFKVKLHTCIKSLEVNGEFVEQNLVLSCSFRCDQIHNNKCDWSEAGLLNKSSCLAAALGMTEFTIVIVMTLVTFCCNA